MSYLSFDRPNIGMLLTTYLRFLKKNKTKQNKTKINQNKTKQNKKQTNKQKAKIKN